MSKNTSKKSQRIDPNTAQEEDLKFYQRIANIALFFGFLFFFGFYVCYNLRKVSDWFKFFIIILTIGTILIDGFLVLIGILVFYRCRKSRPNPLITMKLILGITLCLLTATLALHADIF